ncbi:MAG: class I SAM-dependent methyltransferase, partial [Ignavibacteria bacterium]
MENKKPKTVSFDDYVETYQKEIQSSISFIGQSADVFIELKARYLIEIARRNLREISKIKILDVGCGIGLTDHYLSSEFKNLYGVDVEGGVVGKAKEYNPSVNYQLYNGTSLPFPDETMDLVFAINVMHHIPPDDWKNFTKEMQRVAKTGGLVVVFEHNPLNPLTRLAVSRCEFDKDAVLLTKNSVKDLFLSANLELIENAYIIFSPFKNKIFRKMEERLEWLPLGAQYYV